MIRAGLRALALAVCGITSYAVHAAADLAPLQPALDYHSFANTEQFRVLHFDLELTVDTANRSLRGVIGLKVKRLDPGATQLILDTRDLDVLEVSEKAQGVLGALSKTETTWVGRPFHFERKDPILGSALVIDLPPSRHNTEIIRVEYQTVPAAVDLHWLDGRRSGTGKPFMYTQSEAIGARGWLPLQDTPQVRMTYKATIHTDPGLLAVMSAKGDPNAHRNGEYGFVMPEAVPSCLIALAVGDLKFASTGPRTGVYANKSVIKEATREFAGTEAMLETAERLFGPYRWERFDILMLPANAAASGMQTPRVAFVSATILGGDLGSTSTIAREMAQAWSGNLVTQATWRDTWVNAGITEYVSSRIVETMFGEGRESMEHVLAVEALQADMAARAPADQVLTPDLRGRDPEEAFAAMSAEKGRLFVAYLDSRFGRAHFDEFLRAYLDHFAYESITTDQFLAFAQQNLLDRYPGVVSRSDVRVWLEEPGLPPTAPLPTTEAFVPVEQARTAWLAGRLDARHMATRDWVAQQWIYFLDGMPAALTPAELRDLDQTFSFARSPNAAIAQRWFMLVIRNQYRPGYVGLEAYLEAVGRRQLIAPLYTEMMKTPAGAAQAERVYAVARPGYHPRTAAVIDGIVKPAGNGDSADE